MINNYNNYRTFYLSCFDYGVMLKSHLSPFIQKPLSCLCIRDFHIFSAFNESLKRITTI